MQDKQIWELSTILSLGLSMNKGLWMLGTGICYVDTESDALADLLSWRLGLLSSPSLN